MFRPLYRQSFYEAKRLDELEQWRESFAENQRCRDFIDELVRQNYDGFYLKGEVPQKTVAEFGYDRTMWVLANHIQLHDSDGRFHPTNKAWAQGIYIQRPADWELKQNSYMQDHNYSFLLQSHSCLVDYIAGGVQKLYAALNLYDINRCETGDVHTKNFTGKLLILRPEKLREEFKRPENQLFYATHGNGCTPGAKGRSVFGEFLYDGESAVFDRTDFYGVIDEDQIPEWVAVKRHDMQNSVAPGETESPGMTGMGGM